MYHCPGVYVFFFFFYRPRHHRNLHSFPTRRSSDLGHHHGARHDPEGRALLLPPGPEARGLHPEPGRARASGPRSEEHTSELQSHSDLVCRLLLEKKKTKQTSTPVHRRSTKTHTEHN